MKRRGSVLMEFIIVAPLMLLLVSMILQFSQIWIAREVTAYAAYCACRSALSVDPTGGEALSGAQKAAELACSWMCLAGLPGTTQDTAGGSSETLSLAKFHDAEGVDESTTVVSDNGTGVLGEIVIPGWGSIPGSNSAGVRVKVTDLEIGPPYVRATVKFKFPLMLPLAGRLLSFFVNSDDTSDLGAAGRIDYGHHVTADGGSPAWQGETYVMDRNGRKMRVDSSVSWVSDGRYPYVELTETAVLPQPTRLALSGRAYATDLPKIGGAP